LGHEEYQDRIEAKRSPGRITSVVVEKASVAALGNKDQKGRGKLLAELRRKRRLIQELKHKVSESCFERI